MWSYYCARTDRSELDATGSLNVPRSGHTATLLSNGKVLVAGGFANFAGRRTDLAEVYDPATGAWSIIGSLNSPRYGHTATLLPNRKVLVTEGPAANSAKLYDPETGTWTVIGGAHIPRSRHTATLLPSGKVLVVGGSPDGSMKSFTISAERSGNRDLEWDRQPE